MTSAADLKRTPLFDAHSSLKAKMVDFGGWNMPVQYSGIVEEHNAVRKASGSSTSATWARSKFADRKPRKLVDYVSTNNAAKLKVGQAHYSALLYEHGGFVDDILVHKVSDTEFFLCVNASNQEKDFEHIRSHNQFRCRSGVRQ